MYNRTLALAKLYKRLGWDEPTQASYAGILDTDNKTMSSGRSFQSFHSFVKIPYIHSCQDDEEITNDEFNTWLDNLQKSCITDVLDDIYNEDDLIQNQMVFDNTNVVTEVIDNTTSFVGYRIKSCNDSKISNVINQLITEFDAEEKITFYLFHSSQQDPVKSEEITVAALSTTFTAVSDWEINYNSYKGGEWYIGYLRSGLTTKALNREWDESNIQNSFYTMQIDPFIVEGWDVATLFDIDSISYTGDTYGLNFDISTLKDFTNEITMNAKMFDTAVGLRMAVRVLELYRSTRRSNLDENMAKITENAIIELENPSDELKHGGAREQYYAEIDRIKKLLFSENLIEKTTM